MTDKKSLVAKYDRIVERLAHKMMSSQVPVPGLIIGISGTDSIIAFRLIYEAATLVDLEDKIYGVHYYNKSSWFSREGLNWLCPKFPQAAVFTMSVDNDFGDERRWADLHIRAKKLDAWTVGTINATEKALGKYSLLANSVSLQPITSLWKSEVMALCDVFDVHPELIRRSRIPDCICGRDEFNAENIELIDYVLTNGAKCGETHFTEEQIKKAMEYIRTEKNLNGFRDRVPYTV